ncbi:MAG: DNA-processing protein DprA [Candidatus Goldbacteria bacterium]|nr:DNA-processing protein DprA [Candidatus Goldiibacteriota bacterium]
MEERHALIALNMIDGLGSVKINRLIGRFKKAVDIFKADFNELSDIDGIGDTIATYIKKFDFQKVINEIKECKEKNIEIITIYDEKYPALLKEIYDPPPVLYKYGKDIPCKKYYLGIVGTRTPSDYSELVIKKLIKEMAENAELFCIVSGMARGVDVIAHYESIKAGIFNIAVLGFGFNILYPFENHYIAKEIIKNGCILSEFPLAMIGLKQNFPRRNRIISGLSNGVLIVEAGEKSGALITADCALEQGRDVFAIPGNIFSDKSVGTNNLIKQGAKLVTSINDILEEYDNKDKIKLKHTEQEILNGIFSEEETKILNILSKFEKKHIDNILIESNININKLLEILFKLELKGIIKQHVGKFFTKVI